MAMAARSAAAATALAAATRATAATTTTTAATPRSGAPTSARTPWRRASASSPLLQQRLCRVPMRCAPLFPLVRTSAAVQCHDPYNSDMRAGRGGGEGCRQCRLQRLVPREGPRAACRRRRSRRRRRRPRDRCAALHRRAQGAAGPAGRARSARGAGRRDRPHEGLLRGAPRRRRRRPRGGAHAGGGQVRAGHGAGGRAAGGAAHRPRAPPHPGAAPPCRSFAPDFGSIWPHRMRLCAPLCPQPTAPSWRAC